MKNTHAISGLAFVLLLAANSVHAQDYPAADFQPKIVYSDSSADSAASSSATKGNTNSVEKQLTDANYPAADFQPKVLYTDKDYKHSSTAVYADDRGTVKTAENVCAPVIEQSVPASSNNHLLGLLGLAVVGFLLYQKKPTKPI